MSTGPAIKPGAARLALLHIAADVLRAIECAGAAGLRAHALVIELQTRGASIEHCVAFVGALTTRGHVRNDADDVYRLTASGAAFLAALTRLPARPACLAPCPEDWRPVFSPWRHGGWYVENVVYPSRAIGCVSRTYPDRRWRIACDPRCSDLGAEGDFTFPTRDAAARAEYQLAAAEQAWGHCGADPAGYLARLLAPPAARRTRATGDSREQEGARQDSRRATPPSCGQAVPHQPRATAPYALPARVSADWLGHEKRGFVPTARQQLVMDAVAAALQAGLSAASEVADHVAASLGVDAAVRAVNTLCVEGGDFAYDCHLAERALEVRQRHEAMSTVSAELGLRSGDRLGALVFADGKLAANATVTCISADGSSIGISAARGNRRIAIDTDALSLQAAIDRARDLNKRADGYPQFLAARSSRTAARPDRRADPRQQTLFA